MNAELTALNLPAPDAIAAAAATAPPAVQGRPIQLLLGLGFASGMEFYMFDSVNLVLPDFAGALGVSFDEASWILVVYSSALFLGIPLTGWVAGHFGFRRYIFAAIALFTAASMGCALAPSFNVMLFCRAIQGLAGAALSTFWRASVYLLMDRKQRSPSMMEISTMLYLSSAAGLLLSGVLTDYFNWRLIFVPVLAYAAAAMWLLAACFPDVPPPPLPRLARIDWLGILLIGTSIACLQIVLSRGQIDDWLASPGLRSLAMLSACSLALFVAWQTSSLNAAPLLWIGLLKDRRVLAAALIGVFAGMILSGSLFVLPEFLRQVATPRLSATEAGRIIVVYALAAAALRPAVVPLTARFGQRKMVAGALLMLIASMLVFWRFLTTDTPDLYYLLPLVLYACCLSPLLPSVGSGTVARVEQDKVLDGVTLYITFRQFGASLGVAALTVLLERRETLHSLNLYNTVRANVPAVTNYLAATKSVLVSGYGLGTVDAARAATSYLASTARRQVETLSYADAFLFMACVGALALCFVPLMPPPPARK
jgi:DHA2 family multidrug resistance protein